MCLADYSDVPNLPIHTMCSVVSSLPVPSNSIQVVVRIPVGLALTCPPVSSLVMDVHSSMLMAAFLMLVKERAGINANTRVCLVVNGRLLTSPANATLEACGIGDLSVVSVLLPLLGGSSGGSTPTRSSSPPPTPAVLAIVSSTRESPSTSSAHSPAHRQVQSPHGLPVLRLDGDAFRYIGKPSEAGIRPGATPSAGMFTREGKRYYGKGTITEADSQPNMLRDALKEICANDIYRHLGCHAQKLILSLQHWLPGSEMFQHGVTATSGIHLMSEWIDGFRPFGKDLVEQLRSGTPVRVTVGGGTLRVVGLGQIIAVSMLLNDTDCIGGTGGNVGYTVATDPETSAPLYAQAIKIDPGQAFRYLKREAATAAGHAKHLAASAEEVKQHLAHINPRVTFRIESLPADILEEFNGCMSSILRMSVDDIRQLLTRPGMEPLFPTVDAQAEWVEFLQARHQTLTAAFQTSVFLSESTVVSWTPAECLTAIKSGYRKDAMVMDPVTGVRYSIEERFVNFSLLEKHDDADEPGSNSADGSGERRSEGASSQSRPGKKGSRDTGSYAFGSHGHRSVLSKSTNGGRAALVNSFEAIRAKKSDVAVEDLFLKCVGGSKRVNISGGAGIGKSTCCQSIVSRWAAGRLFGEFTLVVWLPLRRLTSGRYPSADHYTVIDVIIQECLGVHPFPQLRDAVSQLYDVEATLWILDGYDEIVGRVPDHLLAVFEEMLCAPNRILTGRPHAMTGLSGVLAGDVEIEVAGFKDANIEEFVEKFASRMDSSNELLLRYLRKSRLVWDLSHVPVNLVLLCHVFADAGSALDELLLTELYGRVESLMGRRYCAKQGEDVTSLSIERQAELVSPVFGWLSEIAYQAMKSGAIMIPGSSIAAWLTALDSSIDMDGIVWPALQTSGLLLQADGDAEDPLSSNFHFLHLTLQEYFGAKHIASALCGATVLLDSEMDWLRTHKYGFQLEVMWWFVGGLVGFAARAGNTASLTALAELWMAEPREIGRVFEARLWLRMIEEGRLWRLPEAVQPVMIPDALSAARPYTYDEVGGVCLQFPSDPGWVSIRESLEQCPLVCREVILADSCVMQLASYDLLELTAVLGKSILHCEWVWTHLQPRLWGRSDTAVWEFLCPEVLSVPRLFEELWGAVFPGARPPFPSVQQCLRGNPEALVDWIRKVLVKCLPETPCLPVRILVPFARQLVTLDPVSEFLREILYHKPLTASLTTVALSLASPVGPILLETPAWADWLEKTCNAARMLSVRLQVLENVGERGLAVDWIHLVVEAGLRSYDESVRYSAVTVMGGMLPYLNKRSSSGQVLSTWIAAMDRNQWDPHRISRALKKSPVSFMTVPIAVQVMQSAVCNPDLRIESGLGIALLMSATADWLNVPWFSKWLAGVDVNDFQHCQIALTSARSIGRVGLDDKVFYDFILRCTFSVDRNVKIEYLGVLSSFAIVTDVRVVSALLQLSADADCAVRNKAMLSLFAVCGPRLLVDELFADAVHRALDESIHNVRLAQLFSELPKLAQELRGVSVSATATDSRVFQWAVRVCALTVQDDCFVLESASGRGEIYTLAPPRSHNSLRLPRLDSLICDVVESKLPRLRNVVPTLHHYAEVEAAEAAETVLLHACRALQTLVGSDDVKISITSGDGLGAVYAAMSSHLTSVCVQEVACKVLWNLGANSDNCKAVIVSSGGLNHLYAAMDAHLTSAGVQEAACGALRSLSMSIDNKVTIVSSGGLDHIYAAMSGHIASAKLQEASCAILHELARNDENELLIMASGGLDLVYAAMKAHQHSASVQEAGCWIIESLAMHDDEECVIVSSGGAGLVCEAMVTHYASAGVQEAGCWALANLAVNDDNEAPIVSSGGLECLLVALGSHALSPDVQSAACSALENLSGNDENKIAIVERGGLDLIYSAMETHLTAVEVQQAACGALRSLAVNDDNEDIIVSSGGLNRLYSAMKAHLTSSAFQEVACGTLLHLSESPEHKVVVLSSGGLGHVDEAMATHLQSANLQAVGCEVIWSLAQNSDNNKRIILASGCLQHLYSSMATHPKAADVQKMACEALQSLAVSADNDIVRTGGLEYLYTAIAIHLTSLSVCLASCWAITNISVQDINKTIVVATGGLERLYAAMSKHPTSAELQEAACAAFRNLSVDSGNKVTIVSSGGLVRLYAAMSMHPASAGVQEAACRALQNLALNALNKVKIVSSGGLAHVFAGMSTHPTSASIQDAGCRVLWNLSTDAENKTAIVSNGGHNRMYTAMSAHLASVGVQEAACKAIWNLATNPQIKIILVSSGVLDHVYAAMSAHPTSAVVQEAACGILGSLSFQNAGNRVLMLSNGGVELVWKASRVCPSPPADQNAQLVLSRPTTSSDLWC